LEKRVIFAGFGGQGIMLMGRLLSQAALAEGREVVLMQSYGNEMRGGTANCAVVISDEVIGSPIVEKADGCVVMNSPSLERFAPMVRPHGILIINSSLISKEPSRKNLYSFKVPATELADHLGNSQAANMVALGAFIEATQMADISIILNILEWVLPKHRSSLIPLNKAAFAEGIEWLKRLRRNEGVCFYGKN